MMSHNQFLTDEMATNTKTTYPKNYAHGLHIVVFSCSYILIHLTDILQNFLPSPGQSCDWPWTCKTAWRIWVKSDQMIYRKQNKTQQIQVTTSYNLFWVGKKWNPPWKLIGKPVSWGIYSLCLVWHHHGILMHPIKIISAQWWRLPKLYSLIDLLEKKKLSP